MCTFTFSKDRHTHGCCKLLTAWCSRTPPRVAHKVPSLICRTPSFISYAPVPLSHATTHSPHRAPSVVQICHREWFLDISNLRYIPFGNRVMSFRALKPTCSQEISKAKIRRNGRERSEEQHAFISLMYTIALPVITLTETKETQFKCSHSICRRAPTPYSHTRIGVKVPWMLPTLVV